MTSIVSSLVKGTINPLSWLQVQGRLFSFHDTVRNTPLPPVSHRPLPHDREYASSMVTAGATANTTVKNSRASRESGLLCSHSHGESIAPP